MFPTLIRRLAEGSKPPSPIRNAPYRLKKVWPPDFSKLSPAEQFRFEKKYKRRVKLAAARPRWNKFIKLTQLFSVTCKLTKLNSNPISDIPNSRTTVVVVYGLLFMDSKNEHQPFDGVCRFDTFLLSILTTCRYGRDSGRYSLRRSDSTHERNYQIPVRFQSNGSVGGPIDSVLYYTIFGVWELEYPVVGRPTLPSCLHLFKQDVSPLAPRRVHTPDRPYVRGCHAMSMESQWPRIVGV